MKPHLAHIQNTLIKKVLAEDAKKERTSYARYRGIADKALARGVPKAMVIAELESELDTIGRDVREGDDPFFQEGVRNAKVSCTNAIKVVIQELKGEL